MMYLSNTVTEGKEHRLKKKKKSMTPQDFKKVLGVVETDLELRRDCCSAQKTAAEPRLFYY